MTVTSAHPLAIVLAATVAHLCACSEIPSPDSPDLALASTYPNQSPYPNPSPYGIDYAAAMRAPLPPPAATQMPSTTSPQCLDARRGTSHSFAGRLELHPDGSGNLRLLLDRPVCFEGGEFSRGTTDSILVEGDASAAAALFGRRVEARGISVDPSPAGRFRYVFHLGSVALTSSK